ncbi:hypothetical protein OQA88_8535 [Cercophora sp. LCS_1]
MALAAGQIISASRIKSSMVNNSITLGVAETWQCHCLNLDSVNTAATDTCCARVGGTREDDQMDCYHIPEPVETFQDCCHEEVDAGGWICMSE